MPYASTTTLAAIRAASPCEDGWRKLLGALGKTSAEPEILDRDQAWELFGQQFIEDLEGVE